LSIWISVLYVNRKQPNPYTHIFLLGFPNFMFFVCSVSDCRNGHNGEPFAC
jgi:hypothetical protein